MRYVQDEELNWGVSNVVPSKDDRKSTDRKKHRDTSLKEKQSNKLISPLRMDEK